MNEESVSTALFRAASADPEVDVLSWQSIDGKGYFAADVKLRLPSGRRLEPDLIASLDGRVWLIEVKGTHSAATADEAKLCELFDALSKDEILEQVGLRSRVDVSGFDVVGAVAFYGDDLDISAEAEGEAETGCAAGIVHIDWELIDAEVVEAGLGGSLRQLYAAQ